MGDRLEFVNGWVTVALSVLNRTSPLKSPYSVIELELTGLHL